MSKIAPCIWFVDEAMEAAEFYVSLLPDSKIVHVQHNVGDSPGGKDGTVLVVDFTIAGQRFQALNGGQKIEHSWAISLSIDCADQAEVDRLWDAFLAGGGKAQQCGWLSDRWGVNWQIVPRALPEMIADPDREKARRVFAAMMEMVKIDVAALKAAYDGK